MRKKLPFAVFIIAFIFIAATPKSKKLKKQIGAFVLIPTELADSATAMLLPKTYYLFEKEVSNLDYREFLSYIKSTNPQVLKGIEIDTAAWSHSALGGHWNAPGGDVRVKSDMPYDGEPSSYVGFRPVLIIQ